MNTLGLNPTINMKTPEQVRFLLTQEKEHIKKTEESLFIGALPKTWKARYWLRKNRVVSFPTYSESFN